MAGHIQVSRSWRQKATCVFAWFHLKDASPQLQAQRTEKTITEEFEKLFHFLRAEKAARIDAVKKEAARKSEAMNIMIVNLTAEISSLTHKIKTIQKDMKAEDISFMLVLSN